MPNDALTLDRPARTAAGGHRDPLLAGWQPAGAVLNLRGNADDPAFTEGVARALGLALPVQACTTVAGTGATGALRLVWAGPDDWFVLGEPGEQAVLEARLREALAGQVFAVTDVSSGYQVLQLAGGPVRDVLAHGCTLDLHPRAFRPGQAFGTQFFKAGVWLWQGDEPGSVELLVRRSFAGYVWLLLERCTAECGLVQRTRVRGVGA